MKKQISVLIISFITITALTLHSCKKEDNDDQPVVADGTIAFHLHTNVDTTEVENIDSVNVMSSGRKITVHFAQLYLSNIQLVKLDGSTIDVAGAIILKKQQNEVYTLGNVASGNYQSVKFNVGLSPTTNAATPIASDSLLNQPQMWFGANAQPSGFVFVNFQGKIDTTTAHNGTVANMQIYSYKIGTNANLKTVTMPNQNFTVSPKQTQFVHLIIDYSKLFNGIQLNNVANLNMNTVAANAAPLGTQIANNIPLMFRYEY